MYNPFAKTEAGQGLFNMCGYLGKFPHELKECSDEEYEYIKSAWNEMQQR